MLPRDGAKNTRQAQIGLDPPVQNGTAGWFAVPVPRNVLGEEIALCSTDPVTGFYRTGCCDHAVQDPAAHVVCAQVTAEFLEFSRRQGNDLSTPQPQWGFAGLRPGDRWCLCAARWAEALAAGVAPPVVLEATHAHALEWVDLDDLRKHGLTPGH